MIITRFVSLCLRRRQVVAVGFVLLAIAGWFCFRALPIEAYPDLSDTSAQVITQHPGHAAEEVEEQITLPLERELAGTPGLLTMRSRSTFGLSLITLVFRDGTDDYFARQRIREHIGDAELPDGVTPGLDPLTSPIGEIYRYTLESPTRSLRELSELQRWVVIPALKQVAGIADVSNFGGEQTELQVDLEPQKLAQYGLSLSQVTAAIKANNANSGGGVVVRGDQAAVVRGIGLLRSLEDLGHVVVTQSQGTPVFVEQLGKVHLGSLQRNGVAGKDEQADVVTGIVLLLRGANPSRVLEQLHARIDALNHGGLPEGVKLVPYLDRTELVDTTVHTVARTLLEGMGLVLLVLLLFLGSGRAALIVALTVPLSLLTAFILMAVTDVPANLLSLGAIDFGILVDGAIVVLENVLRRREQDPSARLGEAEVGEAATQVARPMFFATVVIAAAYLPLFAFQRVERKLFAPMAFAVGFSLCGALLVALALIPGLSLMVFGKPGPVPQNRWLASLRRGYARALSWLLASPRRALFPALCAAGLAIGLSLFAGREFLPALDEGSLWLQVSLPPGISLEKAATMADALRKVSHEVPQVSQVITQLGRADDGMDPWTPSHIEAYVGLTRYSQWPAGLEKKDVIATLQRKYAALPGVSVGFSQPMIDMVNDKIAGAHSELVVKLYGDDFARTREAAGKVAAALAQVQGAVDVAIDQEPPLPQLQIEVDRLAAARVGVNVADLADLIETGIGGKPVATAFFGGRRYDIGARFAADARSLPESIGALTVAGAGGQTVAVAQVARITLREGESTITHEATRRHLTVRINLRGRDLASFLAEAQPRVAALGVPGVELAWGGQFENQARAQERLSLILPAVLALIFLLLYAAFGKVRQAAAILASLPLALLGGVVALELRGMTLNVASAVGVIALFGVAVQNGVIMVSALNRARGGSESLAESVLRAATERLRPVLLTATVAMLGLLPAALAHGIGSDVQRPLATVVVGGLLSATVLTLLVLPVLYLVIERRALALDGSRRPAIPALAGTAAALALLLLASPARAEPPLDFETYLQKVMAANPDLAATRQAAEVARAQIDVARIFPDPQLTAGLTQAELTSTGNPVELGAQLSVPIELGGKRSRRIAAAEAGVEAASADSADAARTLRGQAAGAFADALRARSVVAEKRRALEDVARLLAANQRRFAAGEISEAALLQSRVEAEQFRAEVLAAEGELAAADVALAQLCGATGSAAFAAVELAGQLKGANAPVENGRLLGALHDRADLRAAEGRLLVAKRQVEVEQSRRVIDVAVNVSWQTNLATAGLPRADFAGATLSVPIPLSHFYSGELDAARATERQAERQLQSVKVRAESELRQDLARLDAASRRVALYEGGVLADAGAVLEKTLYNYERGGATLVEVLIAERTATDVRLAFVDALADRAHAVIAVEQAAGVSGMIAF
jgi:heavy metal efflux system protein